MVVACCRVTVCGLVLWLGRRLFDVAQERLEEARLVAVGCIGESRRIWSRSSDRSRPTTWGRGVRAVAWPCFRVAADDRSRPWSLQFSLGLLHRRPFDRRRRLRRGAFSLTIRRPGRQLLCFFKVMPCSLLFSRFWCHFLGLVPSSSADVEKWRRLFESVAGSLPLSYSKSPLPLSRFPLDTIHLSLGPSILS